MPKNPDVLNAREAGALLNAHIETIRRLARKGNIPSFKVGKDWRFRKEDLIKWAQTHHLRNQLPTVLIVDDESSVRLHIRQLLQKKGFGILEAENGNAGLQCLKNESVGLILLDLVMPVMNGAEFLDELCQAGIKIPVILITGFPDSHLVHDAMKYSPLMLMPKPIDKQQLFQTIGAVIKIPD